MTHPLAGKRIVVTRADAQAGSMVASLITAGAQPILFPTIQIVPITPNPLLDMAVARLYHYDWVVFTSVNGVRIVNDYLASHGLSPSLLDQCQIAAIGSATAHALGGYGVSVALVPPEYVAESLAESILAAAALRGQRCLLLRAASVRPTLADHLAAHGALVKSIPVYQTVLGTPDGQAYAELRAGVDMLTFTSASTVRHFVQLLGAEAFTIAAHSFVACIGPITADAAHTLGLRVDLTAKTYTIAGLLQALEEYQPS